MQQEEEDASRGHVFPSFHTGAGALVPYHVQKSIQLVRNLLLRIHFQVLRDSDICIYSSVVIRRCFFLSSLPSA